jgi:hypothetical protein
MDKSEINPKKEPVIIVTYTDCIQVGFDTSRNKSISKIFYGADPFNDVFTWAKSLNKFWGISQLTFTELVE